MANIFELPSKYGNITPEKARKSRQIQLRDKTAYVWGLSYRRVRSFAIKEAPSPLPALYASLRQLSEGKNLNKSKGTATVLVTWKKRIFQHQSIENDVVF